MPDLKGVIDAYTAAWAETDEAKRLQRIVGFLGPFPPA
jgi:hypothetical protein